MLFTKWILSLTSYLLEIVVALAVAAAFIAVGVGCVLVVKAVIHWAARTAGKKG